jgi:hypothetical protein
MGCDRCHPVRGSGLVVQHFNIVCAPIGCHPVRGLTLRRKGLADDELVRSIKLDSDLEITSVPGRRYAAKYLGEGMLIAGGGTALATTLVMGLLQKLGESACDVATSGPDDCDDRSFTSDTAAAVFFAGVGTAAVGAVLRFVVHKRPSLRIKKISRD